MQQTLKQKRELKPVLRVKLGARLKMAQILESSEEDFARTVKETENEPLFRELLVWGGVKRKRFPGVSPAFFRKVSYKEGDVSYTRPAISDAVDEETAALIKKTGRENFTRFFLVPERIYTVKQIEDETALSKEEIEKIADFVNNFSAPGLAPGMPSPVAPYAEGTRIIAAIGHNQAGLIIEDLNFDLCRGRYLIDGSRVQQLKNSLPSGRKRNLNRIITRLQWINSRRNIIYAILQSLLEKQERFLVSGQQEDLKSLTQRQLSLELEISPSLLNRAIKKRALRLPDGTTALLKNFFPGRREEIKKAIRKIIKEKNGEISDLQIKIILWRDYGLSLSRRTVNFYRNLIK
ncbi:MAG: hypothetical protein ABII89_02080 [Candidatus Omnitrophota bacterium]